MHLGIEYTEKYLENGEKRPFFGNESISLRHRACFFGGLKSGMILPDVFPKNTNAAGIQIGSSPRVSNSPTPSLLLNQFTNLWIPKCWIFFALQHLASVPPVPSPCLKAFPFDQQSLQVVVASEKLMADEMVRSPEKPNG